MNFNNPTLIIVAVAVIVVIYLIIVLRKASAQGISFMEALNPFSSAPAPERDELKLSMAPIVKEMETKEMATFIKHWTDKFANKTLNVQDVELLNSRIAEGSLNQVNGILSLHPDGKKMFDQMNKEIKQQAEALAISAQLAEQPTV